MRPGSAALVPWAHVAHLPRARQRPRREENPLGDTSTRPAFGLPVTVRSLTEHRPPLTARGPPGPAPGEPLVLFEFTRGYPAGTGRQGPREGKGQDPGAEASLAKRPSPGQAMLCAVFLRFPHPDRLESAPSAETRREACTTGRQRPATAEAGITRQPQRGPNRGHNGAGHRGALQGGAAPCHSTEGRRREDGHTAGAFLGPEDQEGGPMLQDLQPLLPGNLGPEQHGRWPALGGRAPSTRVHRHVATGGARGAVPPRHGWSLFWRRVSVPQRSGNAEKGLHGTMIAFLKRLYGEADPMLNDSADETYDLGREAARWAARSRPCSAFPQVPPRPGSPDPAHWVLGAVSWGPLSGSVAQLPATCLSPDPARSNSTPPWVVSAGCPAVLVCPDSSRSTPGTLCLCTPGCWAPCRSAASTDQVLAVAAGAGAPHRVQLGLTCGAQMPCPLLGVQCVFSACFLKEQLRTSRPRLRAVLSPLAALKRKPARTRCPARVGGRPAPARVLAAPPTLPRPGCVTRQVTSHLHASIPLRKGDNSTSGCPAASSQ